MMMKFALCAIALGALVTPALAANEYYVVQNLTTMECSIVEQKPAESAMQQIGQVYDTQAKAAAAIKADKFCATK